MYSVVKHQVFRLLSKTKPSYLEEGLILISKRAPSFLSEQIKMSLYIPGLLSFFESSRSENLVEMTGIEPATP